MKEKILQLRKEGYTYSQIQKELGCAQSTISYHLNEFSKDKAKKRSLKQKREKCECGSFKPKGSLFCKYCTGELKRPEGKSRVHLKGKRDFILNSTIDDYLKNYATNTKATSIRRLARVFMAETKIEKKCKICGFDDYVELCHIKPIKDFDKEAKIKEVNSLDNLVYLCPNHHKLLDIGKIKL